MAACDHRLSSLALLRSPSPTWSPARALPSRGGPFPGAFRRAGRPGASSRPTESCLRQPGPSRRRGHSSAPGQCTGWGRAARRVGACGAPGGGVQLARQPPLPLTSKAWQGPGRATLGCTRHPGLGPPLSLKCQHLRLRLAWLSTIFSCDGPSVPDDGDFGHGGGQAAQGSRLRPLGAGFLPRGCGLALTRHP